MDKLLYILICSTLLFSSSDAEQGEIEYAIKPQFDGAWSFSEGLARVKFGDRYGYINREGRYVINLLFDDAKDFSDSLAAVSTGGKKIYLDSIKSFIIISDKWGYIDREGQYVINPQFDDARDFSEGLAFVENGDKEGYINREGQLVIKLTYEYGWGRDFSEGLAPVWIGNSDRYGYINKEGQYVINPQFDGAESFSEGLARMKISYRYGYIKPGRTICYQSPIYQC